MNVDELIETARAQFEDAEPLLAADVNVKGQKLQIFVKALPRVDWQDLKAQHPMRDGAVRDFRVDYNLDGVTREYPKVSVILNGEPDDLTRVSEDGTTVSVWPALYDSLPGEAIDAVAFAVWGVNDHEVPEGAPGKGSTGD